MLPKQSRFVCNFHNISEYHWLSNHQLLIFHGRQRVRALCKNLPDGIELPLAKLTKLLEMTGGEELLILSPNGLEVIWKSTLQTPYKYYEASLDGTHFTSWFVGVDSQPYWMNDSRHWVYSNLSGVTGYKNIEIHEINHSRNIKQLSLKCVSDAFPGDIINVTLDNHILMDDWMFNNTPSYKIASYPIEVEKINPLIYAISLPFEAQFHGRYISPTGKFIAWRFKFARISLLEKLLLKVCPSYKPHPYKTEELWVSDINGANMREIGYIPDQMPHEDDVALFNIDWTSDESKLNYVYNDNLYTVIIK